MSSSNHKRKLKRLATGAIASLFVTLQLPLLLFMAPAAAADSVQAHGNAANANSAASQSAASTSTAPSDQADQSSSAGNTPPAAQTPAADQTTTIDFNALNQSSAAPNTSNNGPAVIDPVVTLCHATGSAVNPYESLTLSAAGAYNGHYSQDADDIIPAFTYNGHSYSALNMTTANQAIYNNNCQVAAVTPPNTPPVTTDADVTLCHATGSSTNPYDVITISAAGAYNGHYSQHADDIIPSFTYNGQTYGPQGDQTILTNGCVAAPVTPPVTTDADVTLCHATGSSTNPYVQITVSAAGAYNGHYSQHANDIIPAFTYNGQSYSALNMTAANQAIFNNGCQVVPTTPTPPPVVGGRGGGMPTENTTLSLFRTTATPHVLGASTMTGGQGAGELVNTGSSALLNLLAGLFVLGATATVTVASRRSPAAKNRQLVYPTISTLNH